LTGWPLSSPHQIPQLQVITGQLDMVQWVTLSFRNTKVLHQSVTPNNRFNT